MKSISKTQNPNMGGSTLLYITLASIINQMSAPVLNKITDNITFTSGHWYKWPVLLQSIDVSVERKARIYDNKFSFFIPGHTDEITDMLANIPQDKSIVVMRKDSNGLYKLCGSKKFPLSFAFTQESPPKFNNIKGYSINIAGTTLHPELTYSGTIQLT